MLTEWELWAVANATLERHGMDAAGHVAERIAALAARGDAAGVEAWTQIGGRLAKLSARPPKVLNS